MIITLKTREDIIALLDKLVTTGKIKRNIDPNTGTVSFSSVPGVKLANEFIVTRDGSSVLIDDVIGADDENVLVDLMRFVGLNDTLVPANKIARHASNLINNELLATVLLSIRYSKLKPNSILKMNLPMAYHPRSNKNEEVLIVRGFYTDHYEQNVFGLRESVLGYSLQEVSGYKYTMNINAAVQDLIDFDRQQVKKQAMQQEERVGELSSNSTIDPQIAVELRHQIQEAKQEFNDKVAKQLQILLQKYQSLQGEKLALDQAYNQLPKTYVRKAQKGKTKSQAEAADKREKARKSKKAAAGFCEASAVMMMFYIGFVLLPIGGVIYAYHERSYQNAKRELIRGEIYSTYPDKQQKLLDRLTQVREEAANYIALLDPQEAVQYMSLFGIQAITNTTNSTQSYATSSSSAFYSSSNPANANAAAHQANLARQLQAAAESELKIPTKSSP